VFVYLNYALIFLSHVVTNCDLASAKILFFGFVLRFTKQNATMGDSLFKPDRALTTNTNASRATAGVCERTVPRFFKLSQYL